MTNNSKENLLKILVNEDNETPGQENIVYYDKTTSFQTSVGTFFIYDNNIVKFLNSDNKIYVYDENDDLLFSQIVKVSNDTISLVKAKWDIDEEGNIYSIYYRDNAYYLAYWNNPTIPNPNGSYEFKVKRTYNITEVLQNALPLPSSTWQIAMVNDYMLKKCPFDSRFFIGVTSKSASSTYCYNFVGIMYQVNVGGENNYQYLQSNTGLDYTKIINIYTGWTSSNCEFSVLTQSTTTDVTLNDTANVSIYEYKGSMNAVATGTKIKDITNCLVKGTFTNAIYIDNTHKYFTYNNIQSTTENAYLYYYNNTSETLIKSTNTTPEKEGTLYIPIQYNLVKTEDNEVYFSEIAVYTNGTPVLENYRYKFTFYHVNNGTILNEHIYSTNLYIADRQQMLIKKNFNLYELYYADSYKSTFVYNIEGYNGNPYLSNKSVTGETGIIYKNNIPVFARDLYNAEIINNQITNTLQIPNYSLNNLGVTTQNLMSYTNDIVEESSKDLNKNKYEEIFLNWLEQIKVYDNNNGSIYLQPQTYKIAEEIFSGFENDYKITNYRINYTDNTHEDKPIETKNIVDNIATIDLFIYPLKEVKNIEIYDSNFTTPFVTINLNIETNKLYKIRQYIKVE